MNPNNPSLDPDQLLGHAERLRGLACALLADGAAADDVVSDALFRVFRNPPRNPQALGHFLRVVGTNLARMARRAGRRRAHHEAAAPLRPEVESAPTIVARAEMSRRLVDHVLALEEPYRSVILFRYFGGLDAAEIAERSGVPAATVRVQWKRGLAILRERLEREDRRGAHWRDGLAVIAVFPKSVQTGRTGALRPAAPLRIGLAALTAVLGVTLAVAAFRDPGPSDALESPTHGALPEAPPPLRRSASVPETAAAIAVPGRARPVLERLDMLGCGLYEPDPLSLVTLQVAGETGAAIADAAIRSGGAFLGMTDASGAWSVATAALANLPPGAEIVVDDGDHSPETLPRDDVLARALRDAGRRVRVTLAPDAVLAVRVRGDGGRGLGDAVVELRSPRGLRDARKAASDGIVRFSRLPAGPVDLHVRAPGRASVWRTLDLLPHTNDVAVDLPAGRTLTVRVLEASGAPIPSAPVALSNAHAPGEFGSGVTDDYGVAAIDGVDPAAGGVRVTVGLMDSATPVVRDFAMNETAGGVVTVTVSPATLHVHWRDAAGRPVAGKIVGRAPESLFAGREIAVPASGETILRGLREGAHVALDFGTLAAERLASVETVVRGRTELTVVLSARSHVGLQVVDGSGAVLYRRLTLEGLSAPRVRASAFTDPDGYARFELPDGDYRVELEGPAGVESPEAPLHVEGVTKAIVRCPPAPGIRGRLSSENGRGFATERIAAVVRGATRMLVPIEADGRFFVPAIDESPCDLMLVSTLWSGAAPLFTDVNAISDLGEIADPRLPVTFRVREFTSNDPSAEWIMLTREDEKPRNPHAAESAFPRRVATNPRGLLEMLLPPGKWHAAATGDEGGTHAPASFRLPGTLYVPIALAPLAVPIRTGAEPVADIRVRWRQERFGAVLEGELYFEAKGTGFG